MNLFSRGVFAIATNHSKLYDPRYQSSGYQTNVLGVVMEQIPDVAGHRFHYAFIGGLPFKPELWDPFPV
jgi:hypothetical protein